MAQMETAFPEAKLPVPSYVMESSSNHPCHRLSIPAARLFWCRHCMQIFEDPITRWRHSKTCLNSSSRNVKKDRDGRTMQVFVNADNLSHCQLEENKLKSVSRGVGTGKSPSADLRCRICKKTFLSIEEMRTHVRTPCRKRPSLGIAKHKYSARHKDIGAPIQIPDSTSEIIYIKDGHQTVFSLESQSSQSEGIKIEPTEPQPSHFKENAFQYGSCGDEDVIIIPDTFDNTSNLNTIEQTVEITAVEMVPPVVSKSEDIMKQCCKCKENKENNVRKRKRVIPKEIEERPNLKTNVTSSPKGDQQIPPAPLPSVTETPPKDVPEDVESPMVKIAKVMKDLEDLLLNQPAIENVVAEKIEQFPSDNSKGSVTDNLPNDVITQMCEDASEKVEIPSNKDITSDANAESCLKDRLFTSVKMKNQVKLSPKNVKTINLSAVSPHKTSNSNSKCTVRKDLNKSSLSPVPQDNLCLDLFMPVNACSVTLPDPLLDIKNGMPAEVLLDETTSTKPPVAATLPESIPSQDSTEMKEENKLPSYIFEGDLLPLQEHSDVLFEESTIDEKESSEESIIQPVEEVSEVKDCLSSSADVVATENEQLINNVCYDMAFVSTITEPLIKESSFSEMINSEIPIEEIQAIPNESQDTSLDSASDKMTEDNISEVEEPNMIIQLEALQLEDQQPDVHIKDQQPAVQLKDQQPAVQLKDQQPDVQIKDQQPDVQIKDQQPDVQIKDQQPDVQIKDQQPAVQLKDQQPDVQIKDQQPDVQIKDQQPDVQIKDQQPDVQLKDQQPDVQLKDQQPDVQLKDQQPDVQLKDQQSDVQLKDQQPDVQIIEPQSDVQLKDQQPDVQIIEPQFDVQIKDQEPDVQIIEPQSDVQIKDQEPDVQIIEPQSDVQIKDHQPDVQLKDQQPDIQLEGQHSAVHLEGQQPDVQLEGQQPDVQLEGQQPDVQLEGQQPDVQLESQQPDVPQEDQQPDLQMEKPQAKENRAKEDQVTELLEEHQMEESKVEEHKMEEHKVEEPHIKDHHKEHQQIEEVDEIPNREEESGHQQEESSQHKEAKIFCGKPESETKLQKSPKLFKCKACSNTFKTAQALQKHSRVPCKVKHTRSLCQKILRPKRPCVKIEKKPVKKKVVKPPKRPKLIVPITRPEVVRPATPKRPRRFSRRKRRKSSFIDEQKRILPFVNVLMSELSLKDLFFYKLGLINNSCKPTTPTSEIMTETLSICKLGKDKSLIVRRTSADLPPFDNNLEMTNSSVDLVDSALISDVFNDCSLPEGKRKPSALDNNCMPVLEPMTSATDKNCFELENHQSLGRSKNDTEIAADSSVEISVPQAHYKTNESDSDCQNQPSALRKEENISLKKDSDLSSVTCDLKDSFTTDDKNKTCTDSEQSEPESLPVFHTLDSVKLLRKKLQQECNNPISILAQDSRNQHLSTNELHKPPTLDSSNDDAKNKTKKHVVSEGDQYPTPKLKQQSTIEKINNSSVNDSKKKTQTGKESSNSSVVSSSISLLVSNETIAQSNSLANQSQNSSLLNSLSSLVSSPKDATDITPTTDNNSVSHSKSDLDCENKSSDVNSDKESSISLPPSDIVDKNVRTEGPGVCLPNQRSQSPHIPAADSPTSDKHLDSEHLVDKHMPSNDTSVSLCSTQPLHIETSTSLSKKLDVSHSSKQRHFSDIFGNEKSSLVEKDNSNDQHCQISPSKERSKRHFTDFLSSLSENSVNNEQHPEPTHLPECSLSNRDNISKTCGNSSSNQIAKRSNTDPCVSCQHAADTAQNVNQTCHNARCVPEEAKNSTVDVNKSHQISLVKKRTHCYCSSVVPSVSIEPPNTMHRSQCSCCQHQVSNLSSGDAGSISKSCLHTDNIGDSVISFDACAQGCPLKIQDNTLHDNTHAAAHVLSLRHRASDFVSLSSSSVHMNMAWPSNVCQAALSADSSGEPCAFSKQTTVCVPSLNLSTKTGGGTESPLQNSTSQHHHCHHHHHSCIPTTHPTSSTSSSASSSSSSSPPSSSSSSSCITSLSSSTANICSTTTPRTATSSKDVHKSNITLNADSITEVSDKKLTPSLCVAARNSTEHSNDCCSTAANALTIVVENTDSSTTASNANRIAVAASCSESSSSDIQTKCNCSGKFCLPRQKLKGSLCLGNNEDKLSVCCNCCSNSSSSNINNNNNNNIHQHHLYHHHHHHHNCNSNTTSSFLNAKGSLIPESVACLCSKRLETRSAVLKGESNVMSCKNPFQSRVIPSSVICVKRSLNPRISVATQTESSFLKEAKVVPAVSSTSETTKTCDSVKETTGRICSSSLQTCPKQIPEPSSLEQQLTSEEVVQEEILLDANTLPVVGETLINTQLPAVGSEEIQFDTEHKDSPVSNSLICASDSTRLACSGKASNSVSSFPTNIPTSIGATELMAVSSVGSESNVYVQYVGEFDPSLLPEEVTFVIIQGDSGEGVQVADGQSLIIEGSGFEEPTDGASVPLQANIPVAYALQQREDIAGDSECIVSEM